MSDSSVCMNKQMCDAKEMDNIRRRSANSVAIVRRSPASNWMSWKTCSRRPTTPTCSAARNWRLGSTSLKPGSRYFRQLSFSYDWDEICCTALNYEPYNGHCRPTDHYTATDVKKLWFIHELTANDTSKTAKITKR